MKIGITGGAGFIGWHLRCYLATRNDVNVVKIAGREEFGDLKKLCDFVDGLDVLVHLAGVNRADDNLLVVGNVSPAAKLVEALESKQVMPHLIYTSSTKVYEGNTPYAEGKSAATDIFREWSRKESSQFTNLIVPHVFGEYGRPYYNSAVATFSHQIARGEAPSVHQDAQLELVHVQDLAGKIIETYIKGMLGEIRIEGRATGVKEAAELLTRLYSKYVGDGQIPDLSDHFVRCMFNTVRAAIPYEDRHINVTKHKDDRGWLVETVKAHSGGQCFVSTSKPGITRGNHFHLRKFERFLVLQGMALIRMRKLFTSQVTTYSLDGDSPSFVDMPTMHTHSITNVGHSELITLFWSDEIYNPESPDTTFAETVI